MPRPKGSKNKPIEIIENVDEKIAAVEAEIEQMKANLKAKNDELKDLKKAKIAADKAAEEKRRKRKKPSFLR